MFSKKIYIGTSGYNYKHWGNIFYPQNLPRSKWLSFYSRHFNSVEINATFYGSFKKRVFEKWNRGTPDDFKFSIKGSKFITHIKRLKDVEEPVERFFASAQGLNNKLSVVLWQFPASFQFNPENQERLEKFISLLPKDARQAFEFRHESWFQNTIFTLLDSNRAGFVINDSGIFPFFEKITEGFSYIRFHGPTSLYSSSYSDQELKIWAEKIRVYLEKYDIYCYFNNDTKGYAVKNAKKLENLLKKQ